jgi:vacuolar-type H+-ATPase subunit E/Vma4
LDESERGEDIASEFEETHGYRALGARVTGILEAAEQAAEEIRAEARKQASELERQARLMPRTSRRR